MRQLTPQERRTLLDAKKVRAKLRKASDNKRERPKKDRGRERDNGFLQYLRRQPCEAAHLGGCWGPPDPAHIRYSDARYGANPGMGKKNHDRHCNPLCRGHHSDQHDMNEQAFWHLVGKNAYETAAGHYAAYQNPRGRG